MLGLVVVALDVVVVSVGWDQAVVVAAVVVVVLMIVLMVVLGVELVAEVVVG